MLTKLKALLKITDSKQDELLQLLLDGAKLAVITFCSIETLPAELEDVVCRIAAYDYRVNKPVLRSDSHLTYLTDYEISASKNNTMDISDNYKKQMNSIRKMRWHA